jgi:hypothetical protein
MYHAFGHYRDLGAKRSIDKAFRAHMAACEGVQIGKVRAPRHWSRAAVGLGAPDRAVGRAA